MLTRGSTLNASSRGRGRRLLRDDLPQVALAFERQLDIGRDPRGEFDLLAIVGELAVQGEAVERHAVARGAEARADDVGLRRRAGARNHRDQAGPVGGPQMQLGHAR